MRVDYTDEELKALAEIASMLGSDIRRMTDVTKMCLAHLVTCEDPDHRAAVCKKLGVAVAALLNHIRYCAWIEAGIKKTRVIPDPQRVLEEMVAKQQEVAAEFKEKQEAAAQPSTATVQTVPSQEDAGPGEAAPAAPVVDEAAAMDKLATHKGPETKQ